ncbi:MAG: hypothetical protein K0R87_3204, partial [Pseudonocardia sp.]|nr:hypothetical protein [Pseudonocardia sp.]
MSGPSDLDKRPYPPTGEKELWVRFGPDRP